MKPLIQLKQTTTAFFVGLLFVCIALSPNAQAVVPPPDGGYPGGNTGEGHDALLSLTSGRYNTAIGNSALFSNTAGSYNTATGYQALLNNIGVRNTATGAQALSMNTTGNTNTATGAFALSENTTGRGNTATGAQALLVNTTGTVNTANGSFALNNNRTGSQNTATGSQALFTNDSGQFNTANGEKALYRNTNGIVNTAIGVNALFNNTTGNNNIAVGVNAGQNLTTGDNNIDVGNAGVGAEANTMRIGTEGRQTQTFIAGINGAGVSGTAVEVNAAGQLGTAPSSRRFKEEIKLMDQASEAILALKPVSFCYKKEIDPERTPQFGLVAEDVEKVSPDLIVRDKEGKPYSVRYEAVNAMLLNEFLKEHRKVEQQEKTIVELKSGMIALAATVKEQAAQIQKVSTQFETNRPTPQVVNNP
jgi:Chaperone of endosialidase